MRCWGLVAGGLIEKSERMVGCERDTPACFRLWMEVERHLPGRAGAFLGVEFGVVVQAEAGEAALEPVVAAAAVDADDSGSVPDGAGGGGVIGEEDSGSVADDGSGAGDWRLGFVAVGTAPEAGEAVIGGVGVDQVEGAASDCNVEVVGER